MAFNAQQRAQFISEYAKVVVGLWHNPQFANELEKSPVQALASVGLKVAPNATVNIVRAAEGSGNIDQQVDAWENGQQTGKYTLYLPPNQASVGQVSLPHEDLDRLHGVAAAASDVSACCCCCPCCSCT